MTFVILQNNWLAHGSQLFRTGLFQVSLAFYYFLLLFLLFIIIITIIILLNSHLSQFCLSKNCKIRPFVTDWVPHQISFSRINQWRTQLTKTHWSIFQYPFPSIHLASFSYGLVGLTWGPREDHLFKNIRFWEKMLPMIMDILLDITYCLPSYQSMEWKQEIVQFRSIPEANAGKRKYAGENLTNSHSPLCCALDSRVYCSFNQFGLRLQSYIP